MADEQPNESLSPASSAPGPAADAPSQPATEAESSGSWWSRLFNRPDKEPSPSESETPEPAAPKKLELTEEELHRRVQSEVDKRQAQANKAARDAERRRLRDEDPWQYAEQERKAEQAQVADSQFMGQLHQIGAIHDRTTIDPLLGMLPEAERTRILNMEGAGVGLDGRKLIVNEALKTLEKEWKKGGQTEAERKLRTNEAFRKQLLAEMRGQRTPEPDLLPASPTSGDRNLSSLLRQHYNLG